MADMTRRKMLKAAPAVAVAAAVPSVASTGGGIEALVHEWMARRAESWQVGIDAQDAFFDQFIDPLEARINAIPAVNEREMLLKALVDTRGGEFEIEPPRFREAVEMLGLTDEMRAAFPHS